MSIKKSVLVIDAGHHIQEKPVIEENEYHKTFQDSSWANVWAILFHTSRLRI